MGRTSPFPGVAAHLRLPRWRCSGSGWPWASPEPLIPASAAAAPVPEGGGLRERCTGDCAPDRRQARFGGWATFEPNPEGATDFAVVRVLPDGTPDSTFSTDGIAIDIAGSDDYALAVIQQTDGKLVLTGRTSLPNGTEDIALARFSVDGKLDTTFGNRGKVTLDIGGSHDLARGLLQQPDGKLVIAGGAISGGDYRFVFARYNVDGTLDTTFGTGGTTFIGFGAGSQYSWADGLALQQDGKLVAVGRVGQYQPFDLKVGIARLTANGTLDPSFSGDGLLAVDVSGNEEQAFAVALQPDDAIVVAGSSVPAGASDIQTLLLRVDREGNLDNGFRPGAVPSSMLDAVFVQADGDLITVGTRFTEGGGRDMILARFNSDGTLDTAYGIDGVATADFGAGGIAPSSSGSALIRQGDGKYVVAGPNGRGTFGAARFDDAAEFAGMIGLTITDRSVAEATQAVSYTVRRTGGSTGAVSVNYATAPGAAQPGSDFANKSGALSWTDGDASDRTIVVDLINDSAAEANEDFLLTLSAPTAGAQLAATVATTIITSEDGPGQLRFRAPFNVREISEFDPFGEGFGIRVEVERTGGSTGPVSVSYATVNGSATAGEDFRFTSGTLSWAGGEIGVKSIAVVFFDDRIVEGNEEFEIRLSNPTGGATTPPSGATQRIRILDDELAVRFANSTGTIGEAGGSITLTVVRGDSSAGAASVDYATSSGSATADADFASKRGTLNWTSGDSGVKTITVNITNDTIDEGNETFTVRLSNPSAGTTLGLGRTANITIVDDDPPGGGASGVLGLAAIAATVGEGNSIVLSAVRSGGSSGAVSVNYATSSGTATAGTDFMDASGTLSWADGDSANKIFTINITNDTTDESDETFSVTLFNPSGGTTLGNSALTVKIVDDDASGGGGGSTLGLSSTAARIDEAGTSIVLTVARNGAAVGAVSVDYATSNGTAITGSDFAPANGTLHWADGDSTGKSISVNVTDDGQNEGDEIFTLTLANPSGAVLGSNSVVTVTITDNDSAGSDDSSDAGGGGSSDRLFLLGLLLIGLARSLNRRSATRHEPCALREGRRRQGEQPCSACVTVQHSMP